MTIQGCITRFIGGVLPQLKKGISGRDEKRKFTVLAWTLKRKRIKSMILRSQRVRGCGREVTRIAWHMFSPSLGVESAAQEVPLCQKQTDVIPLSS